MPKDCCGRGKSKILSPTVSPDQKKIVDEIRSANSRKFGALKRGNRKVTFSSRQCSNCHTVVSDVIICPICGTRL